MPWPIRFLDAPPLRQDGTVDFDKLKVGDLCYVHHDGQPVTDGARLKAMHLTAHYFAHNATRPPLQLAPTRFSQGLQVRRRLHAERALRRVDGVGHAERDHGAPIGEL